MNQNESKWIKSDQKNQTHLESLSPDFNDGQHDLGGGWTQSHQSQVGNSFIPNFDHDDLVFAGAGILNGNFFLLSWKHTKKM